MSHRQYISLAFWDDLVSKATSSDNMAYKI